MTRAECEKAITEKMMEIHDIYMQFNPDFGKGTDELISLSVFPDSINFWDTKSFHHEPNDTKHIDFVTYFD